MGQAGPQEAPSPNPKPVLTAGSAIRPDQVAQGCICNMGLKTSRGGDCTACSIVLCSYEENISSVWSEPILLQLMPTASQPLDTHCCEQPGSISLVSILEVLRGCCWVLLQPSPLQVNQPWSLGLSSQGMRSVFTSGLAPVYRCLSCTG